NLKLIGIDVTMLIRSGEMGKMFDQDMQTLIVDEAQRAGLHVHFHEDVEKILGQDKAESVLTNQGQHDTDMVIVATGIKPATNFLESTAIKQAKNGAIQVNEYLETNLEDIYAAGDCAMQYHRVK